MRVPKVPPPTKEELEWLYLRERLSSNEVAARLGIERHTVQNWMKKYGIPRRSVSEAAKMRETRPAFAEFRKTQLREAATHITPEGRKRQGKKISGPREPWPDEVRAKHAYRQTPEYRKKLSEVQKGEKGHWWRGGVTDAEIRRMHGWEWRQRRAECYERDRWICQDCGCQCLNGRQSKSDPKRRIQAHHIITRRNGGTDDLTNLVTLCASCHRKREAKGVTALFA